MSTNSDITEKICYSIFIIPPPENILSKDNWMNGGYLK